MEELPDPRNPLIQNSHGKIKMRYLSYGAQEKSSYKICILVNEIRKDDIHKAYIAPYGLDQDEIIVITLHQTPNKRKTPVAEQKAYITEELTTILNDLQVQCLVVTDGDYFKTFSKKTKLDTSLGYVFDTEFGPWKVVYAPSYRTIFHDPARVIPKIQQGISALKNWLSGSYAEPGIDIIKFSAYPMTPRDIGDWLRKLLDMNCPLSVDIEGFSLKHYSAGVGTIAFAWNKHEGIAFPVDILDDPEHSIEVRGMLKNYFIQSQQRHIYHNIGYDAYVLIYQLFMYDLLDNPGLLDGMNILLRNWDDTKLISYLAVNSCAGNNLSLKDQAQEFAGDYAKEDIKDIRKIPLKELLQYNLVDALSTWFVYEKNHPIMVADQQLDFYNTIFKPAMVDIIQMQLTGMPMDMDQVIRVKEVLQGINDDAIHRIKSSPLVRSFHSILANEWAIKKNQTLKVKRVTPSEFKEEFNPNSSDQLVKLLYDTLGLPVIARTDTKAPSTKGKVLIGLQNHTQDPDIKTLLEALVDYKAVDKLLTSFIPAFENAQKGPDGWHWLFGYFNLGGTVSGRLSSSNPNLQNLPANVDMTISQALFEKFENVLHLYVKDGKLSLGKLIKSCFKAPPGWHFGGIDFSSLEDRISALTTKDPNKLKVYEDGYDGHSLRAVAYFGDQMPDIDSDSVDSVNQLAVKGHKYGNLRQDSKTPTFLLTYGGTFKGIMEQLGWSQEKALEVEDRYHVLYKVSDEWVSDRLDQASKVGYVTVAFGLRVRTPLLHQTVRNTSKTPYQATAEGRTAGNAMGQSWCLLNSRAGSEFMGKVRNSNMKHDIKPCAQIHDAQYYLLRDDIDVIEYANFNVVKACQWQNHPDIWHDTVKLGGEFSIFYPDWSQEAVIPNNASQSEIYEVFEKHVTDFQKKSSIIKSFKQV